ncbi:Hpt domain-containing protein [Polaromonas sp.]|uniref:Hpt domain-containing protein n=1 Tax=Polaromonas sp. TaxID=1869339 RepID=UPI0032676C40
MNTPQQEFQKFLDEQRADYRRLLPEKMAQIHALWQAAATGGDAAAPALADLGRLAHTLAGTAGTLGFREAGLAAKALELLLEQAGESGSSLPLAGNQDIVHAIAALQASLPSDAPLS